MSIETLDAAAFRRELAGLADKEAEGGFVKSELRERAANLCLALAIAYNRSVLEPTKLWERIASALATACENVDDGDLDKLVSLALDHVKAEHSHVASNDEIVFILGDLTEQPEDWRLAFVRYLKQHSFTSVIHGRRLWETRKEERSGSHE